jgi:probable rRNA maturation factor
VSPARRRGARVTPASARGARVTIDSRTQHRPLSRAAIARAVEAALEHGGRSGIAVGVVLVGDATLARMHGRWLGDPSPTDVIGFELGEEGGGAALELYVSAERAVRVARRRGVAAGRELALYLVHGALHACGYDDRTARERSRMRAAEDAVLAKLGYARDPTPFDAEPRRGAKRRVRTRK